MNTISTGQLQAALISAARRIIEAEPYLTEVDTIIGDGDHGSGMKAGFTALERQLAEREYPTPRDLLHASGLCLVRSMGGASGVLFGTLLIGGLDQLRDGEGVSAGELAAFWRKGVEAIQNRGRAQPGDKTMVDALLPAAKAMEAALQRGGDIPVMLRQAYQAALEGVESTRQMMPRLGRSKNFREKAVGYPDPGAISVSLILQGLCDGVQQQQK